MSNIDRHKVLVYCVTNVPYPWRGPSFLYRASCSLDTFRLCIFCRAIRHSRFSLLWSGLINWVHSEIFDFKEEHWCPVPHRNPKTLKTVSKLSIHFFHPLHVTLSEESGYGLRNRESVLSRWGCTGHVQSGTGRSVCVFSMQALSYDETAQPCTVCICKLIARICHAPLYIHIPS